MPRNKYPEVTVKKIMDVSLRLFLEKGYEQTTVLDIVANLGGLTRGAFYHHFKSKEEVLGAIMDESFHVSPAFERAKHAKVANGLERVRLALKGALLENVESEERTAVTHLAVALMNNPRFLAEKLKGDIQTANLLAPMIEEGMADGSIRPGNAKALAELFMVLVNIWMMPAIFPGEPEETFAKGEMVIEILDGLGFPVLDEEMREIFKGVAHTVLHGE